MPPFPFLPPISPAKFQNEFTLRSKLPPGISLRSLPHSTANVHPFGALGGISGAGDCNGRARRDFPPSEEMKAPRPWIAVKRCPDGATEALPSGGYAAPKNGAYITPTTGTPPTHRPILTHTVGNKWT